MRDVFDPKGHVDVHLCHNSIKLNVMRTKGRVRAEIRVISRLCLCLLCCGSFMPGMRQMCGERKSKSLCRALLDNNDAFLRTVLFIFKHCKRRERNAISLSKDLFFFFFCTTPLSAKQYFFFFSQQRKCCAREREREEGMGERERVSKHPYGVGVV